MLDKVLAETNCDFEVGLAWCVNSKNSLNNIHGFSSHQMILGQNPVLPGMFDEQLPSLEDHSVRSSEIIRQNLNALHSARVAFMESERLERLRRAWRTNTRTYSDQVILNGDKVFYKRKDANKWRGPAILLGRDGQQFLLKHGGFYIRVHPCRLRLARDKLQQVNTPHSSDSDAEQDATSAVSPASELAASDVQTEFPDNAVSLPQSPSDNTLYDTSLKTDNPASSDFTNSSNSQELHPQTKITTELSSLRKGDVVSLQMKEKYQWDTVRLHSRSGKVTGKWKNSWNVEYPDKSIRSIDFQGDVPQWKYIEPFQSDSEHIASQSTTATSTVLFTDSDDEVLKAKEKELESWKENHVYDYEEVPDEGQKTVSVRWVVSPKVVDGLPSVKARLVAKGYQEADDFRKDSPTCSRESIRVTLAVIASNSWNLQSIDIQVAFLQVQILIALYF